jgi:hypothetical protein
MKTSYLGLFVFVLTATAIGDASAQTSYEKVFNIKDPPYNAQCDGVTDDSHAIQATVNAAAAATPARIYTPQSPSYCLIKTTITVPNNTLGLSFEGDAPNISVNQFSGWVSSGGVDVLHINGSVSGAIGNIEIRNMQFWATGSGSNAVGLNIENTLHFNVTNVVGRGPIGIRTAGSWGNFTNTQALGSSYAYISEASPTTNDGMIDWQGGKLTMSGCTTTDQATILIKDIPLGVGFQGGMISLPGCPSTSVVRIEGSAIGTQNDGYVSFRDMHCESTYNTTNDLSIYRIGQTYKAANVLIEGGNCWGQGNGTNYAKYFAQIFSAKNVTIRNVQVSRLAASHGFDGGFIRLENTFASSPFAGGDIYDFRNNQIDNIAGPLYSDNRPGAPLAAWKLNATNNNPLDGYWLAGNLPTCVTTLRGLRAVVTDANAPLFNNPVVGGGPQTVPVMCNGTRWGVF